MSPPPSSALPATYFLCQMTTQTCQPTWSRACLRRQHACLHETVFWKIVYVFRPLCPLARVCVHRRVVTYSRHFLLRYSHGTFSARFVVSSHSRVCVRVSLNPRVVTSSGHFDLCYCNTFHLAHVYSFQHPLLLMHPLSVLRSSFS